MKLLFTGLTGTVGSCLAPSLNEKNNLFCLVRDGQSRVVNGKLRGVDKKNIINGDITLKNCGLSEVDLCFLKKQRIDKIFHCAASIRFDRKYRRDIWRINFLGTRNMIKLAKELGIKEFHYVSTAYSDTKRNPYEESKSAAENLVKKSGLLYTIYLPTVIVGHSETGEISSFDGFYGCMAGIIMLVRLAQARRQSLYLPLYIDTSYTSTLNLVPINWVVKIFVKLLRLPARGKTYFLVHPRPPTVYQLYQDTFRKLGVHGIKYNYYTTHQSLHLDPDLQRIQERLNKWVKFFLPYLTEEIKFSSDMLRFDLANDYAPPPEISTKYLYTMIDFILSTKFNRAKVAS